MKSETGKLAILCLISGHQAALLFRSSSSCAKPEALKNVSVELEGETEVSMFDWRSLDLGKFDAFGNYLEVNHTDLPDNHTLCKRLENYSKVFKRFAGLLLFNRDSRAFNVRFADLEPIESWDFGRLDLLILDEVNSILNEEDEADDGNVEGEDNQKHFIRGLSRTELRLSTQLWDSLEMASLDSAIKLKRGFPHIFTRNANLSMEQLALGENFIVDFVELVLPSLRSTQISKMADLAGVLTFLVLLREKQGAGMSTFTEDFSEFFEIMKKASGCQLDLIPNFDASGRFCLEGMFESLLFHAIQHDLLYTMEMFYAMEMIDFRNELLLKNLITTKAAAGGILFQRFLDFVDFKQDIPSFSSRTTLLHYIFDKNPCLFSILCEYERIDWSMGERFDENDKSISCGLTIFGKLLSFLKRSTFDYGTDTEYYNRRYLISQFLAMADSDALLIERSPDLSIFDLCLKDEESGLKLLQKLFFIDPECRLQQLTHIANDIMKRSLSIWRQDGSIRRMLPVVQYLLRNYYGWGDLHLINEMMLLLSRCLQQAARASPLPSPRSKSTSTNRSLSRSSSGDFLRSLFSFKSSSNSLESLDEKVAATSIGSSSSPNLPDSQSAVLDLMKSIIFLAENSALSKDIKAAEMINSWNSMLAPYII